MHNLLKRQLRKYMPEGLKEAPEMEAFLEAIERSYVNFDEKLSLIQRATAISSEELSEANNKLIEETAYQKKILASLRNAVLSLEAAEEGSSALNQNGEFDPLALAQLLEKQAAEIKTMARQKNELFEELKIQNEALENYAHMVSHDLKSPLRNIHTLMGWIGEEETHLSQDSQDNLKLVNQNIEKMDQIISGILEHAMIKEIPEKEEINTRPFLDSLLKTLYIPENVSVQLAEDLPKVSGHAYSLELVFKNLIENSVRAMEQVDGALISIKALPENENWHFVVQDNGKGIPKRFQKVIFEMFKRLENDSRATGIGLALVKKIINLHQGEIWIVSEEGAGTSVHFTIPKSN
jgi:signal transduction histidine kinase